ncbi:MAG: diaminopimelate epimerase [Spirochaetaceae bacterium]|nr:MAG: diaminopimelate epimerase [Spirochaetaceae bacterium]
MDIEFIKLQACGNDYIVVDTFKNTILNLNALPDLAAQITSRRFGVGAVGLLFIAQGREEKLRMLLYDPYGEEVLSDGLALRCLARYAFDSGLVNTETFRVHSGNRIVAVEVLDSQNILLEGDSPRHWQQDQILSERIGETFRRPIKLGSMEINYTPVFVDVPHAVIFARDYGLDYPNLVQELEDSAGFDEGTMISMVRVISREALSLRTWQVGLGEILSCESAAYAAVTAAVLDGLADRAVRVHLEGGNLLVEWSEEDNRFFASGPVEYVFMGTYYYEEVEEDED